MRMVRESTIRTFRRSLVGGGLRVIALQVGFLVAALAQAPQEPALSIRLDRPAEQLRRAIALFEGTTAPHPAAALSQWKRATGGKLTLGKTLEALIAAMNPGMIEELRSFDDAEFQLTFPADAETARWNATLPGDASHLFAAFATAMALTDGGPEPALGPFQVDRLGPKPDGILMAHDGSRVILGGDPEDLRRGLARLNAAPPAPGSISGVRLTLYPERFRNPPSLAVQRALEAARGLSLQRLAIHADIDGETFRIESEGRSAPVFEDDQRGIDPSWVALPSSDRAMAIAAMRFDGSPAGLDRLFAVVDHIEKSDPSRAKAAPARTRLNLLALTAGIRPEVELWPKLEGISACLIGDRAEPLAAAVVGLHLIDEASAERLAVEVLPKLSRSFGLKEAGNGALGTIAGQAVTLRRQGKSVLVVWGTVGESAPLSAPWQALPDENRASRILQVLPGRVPVHADTGSPLAEALDALPPIVWEGTQRDGLAIDRLQINGLKRAVRVFLDRLPREAPPAEFRDIDPPVSTK